MIRSALLELLGIFKAARQALFAPCCRFYPSCTEYAEEALRTRGVVRAVLCIIGRLSRCHPLHPGGFDPVV